jgi:hypothetical protein
MFLLWCLCRKVEYALFRVVPPRSVRVWGCSRTPVSVACPAPSPRCPSGTPENIHSMREEDEDGQFMYMNEDKKEHSRHNLCASTYTLRQKDAHTSQICTPERTHTHTHAHTRTYRGHVLRVPSPGSLRCRKAPPSEHTVSLFHVNCQSTRALGVHSCGLHQTALWKHSL